MPMHQPPYMRDMVPPPQQRQMPPSLMDPRMEPRFFQSAGPPRWDHPSQHQHPHPGGHAPFPMRRPDYPGPPVPHHAGYPPRHLSLYDPNEPARRGRFYEDVQRRPTRPLQQQQQARPKAANNNAKPPALVKPQAVGGANKTSETAQELKDNKPEKEKKQQLPSAEETAALVGQIENMLQELMSSGKNE